MHTSIQLQVNTRPVELRRNTAPTLIAQVKGGPPGTGVELLTTLGDLITHDGADPVRLPSGLDGQMLTADSTTTEGLLWGGVVVVRAVTQDLTIRAGTTAVQRNPEIADGVLVIIEDTGELLTL